MDLSNGYDLPNPYGLSASVFDHDMESYSAALKFLSDLAGGTPEPEALELNGGSVPMLRSWQRSDRFRRVHDKCRRAGEAERAVREAKGADTEGDETTTQPVSGQRFIPFEDMPVQRSVFALTPGPDSWGGS